jgi:hypothetical protein
MGAAGFGTATEQVVVVQHVDVAAGSRAIVAGPVTPGAAPSEQWSPRTRQLGICLGSCQICAAVWRQDPERIVLCRPSDDLRWMPDARRSLHRANHCCRPRAMPPTPAEAWRTLCRDAPGGP